MRTEPDPREARLPTWARGILTRLRADLLHAEELAETAERAAELAQTRHDANVAPVKYDGPDGVSYGLPGVSVVRINDIMIELTDGGILLDTLGRLVIEPTSATTIRIRSVR